MKMRARYWVSLLVVLVFVGVAVCLVHTIPPVSETMRVMEACKRRIQHFALLNDRLPAALDQTPPLPGDLETLQDGWGNDIMYAIRPNETIVLLSYGRDGKPGGSDADADIQGIYPARQADGKWSGEDVEWIRPPGAIYRQ